MSLGLEFATQMLNIEPLTGRDLEFLRAIAAGKTNSEIGREMYLGINTIKTHLKRMYVTMGVRNRAEAVYVGMRLGLIQ